MSVNISGSYSFTQIKYNTATINMFSDYHKGSPYGCDNTKLNRTSIADFFLDIYNNRPPTDKLSFILECTSHDYVNESFINGLRGRRGETYNLEIASKFYDLEPQNKHNIMRTDIRSKMGEWYRFLTPLNDLQALNLVDTFKQLIHNFLNFLDKPDELKYTRPHFIKERVDVAAFLGTNFTMSNSIELRKKILSIPQILNDIYTMEQILLDIFKNQGQQKHYFIHYGGNHINYIKKTLIGIIQKHPFNIRPKEIIQISPNEDDVRFTFNLVPNSLCIELQTARIYYMRMMNTIMEGRKNKKEKTRKRNYYYNIKKKKKGGNNKNFINDLQISDEEKFNYQIALNYGKSITKEDKEFYRKIYENGPYYRKVIKLKNIVV